MANIFRTPVFVSDVVPDTVSTPSYSNPEREFKNRLLEAVRTYVMATRWTLLDFYAPTSRDGQIHIRISLRPPGGATEDLDLAFAFDWYTLASSVRNHQEIGNLEISQSLRTIEREMAQWNQRRTEQLQNQARQRQEAAERRQTAAAAIDQEQLYTVFNNTAISPLGINITNQGLHDYQPFTMANTQFIQQQGYQIVEDEETPLKLRLSEFKELLKASLEELDIRISLDISDGEVTAEVEVLLDGEVVASDSDFIQL
jgi:hypothetical protein